MLYQLQEQGMEPKALQNRPHLPDYLHYSYELFWELSDQRLLGESFTGAIPVSEFMATADLRNFDEREKVELWQHVRVMDLAYRSFIGKRHREQAERANSRKGNR